jgi:hypothetical protein
VSAATSPARPDGDAVTALSLLISGVLFWGGVGAVLTWWLGPLVYAGAGVTLGGVLGVVAVCVRYGGRQPAPESSADPGDLMNTSEHPLMQSAPRFSTSSHQEEQP